MDRATVLQTLTNARTAWEELLKGISAEDMQQPRVTGKWSIKDIIAHIMWGEREVAEVMRTRALVASSYWELADDESNEIIYQQQKDRPLQAVIDDEQRAYTALLEAVQTLSDEELNDPHCFQNMPEQWQPWQLIAGESFKHFEDHMPDIRAWLQREP